MVTQHNYRHAGVHALIVLHERHLRAFLETWRIADARDVALPTTEDPNYTSREALLAHVLGCAAGYLTWVCEQLDLPRPQVQEHPEVNGFAVRADAYVEEVLRAWRAPSLHALGPDDIESQVFQARWGTPYCIDAMLEHAVMHPIRHTHQLMQLIDAAEA